MPTSDFIYDKGEKIDVGANGQNDIAFAEGEPIPDGASRP